MDVIKAIKRRHSVRNYTGKKISDEELDELLKTAREAPSARNLQPWRLVVVTGNKKKRDLIHACHNQAFVEDAGALLVGITEDKKWADIDLAIALDHLSLTAVELGLGTCWMGAFREDELKEKLDIPDEYEVTICMAVGHPGQTDGSPVKKSVDEMIHWEKFERKG